ncbi:hypothetical protein D3C87_1783540 [compost metagenome]
MNATTRRIDIKTDVTLDQGQGKATGQFGSQYREVLIDIIHSNRQCLNIKVEVVDALFLVAIAVQRLVRTVVGQVEELGKAWRRHLSCADRIHTQRV